MNLTTNPYAQGRDLDSCESVDSLEFNTYQEAKQHLESCGYWSAPIWLPEDQQEIFDRYYIASDWSTSGLIHFKKR